MSENLCMDTCGRRFRRAFFIKSSVFSSGELIVASQELFLHGNATSEHSAATKMTETRKEAKQNRTYSTLFSVVGFFVVIARLTLSKLIKINGDRRNFDFVGNTHIEAHLSWNNRDED